MSREQPKHIPLDLDELFLNQQYILAQIRAKSSVIAELGRRHQDNITIINEQRKEINVLKETIAKMEAKNKRALEP